MGIYDAYSDVIPMRDAVVSEIAALMDDPGWPAVLPTLVPKAVYDIVTPLVDLPADTGQLIVCPAKKTDPNLSRAATDSATVELHVCVQFKYGSTGPTPTVIDPYMALAEHLARTLKGATITTTSIPAGAGCTECTWPQLFIQKHFEDFRIFTSVFALTFLMPQAPATPLP